MNGLIMDYQLTIPAILRRTEALFGHKQVVSRLPDKSLFRYTYADMIPRSKQLGLALKKLGIETGDRVGTFCWNHHLHLEAYFGIPGIGAVLHTLNLRLHPDDLTYIANHANDKAIIVDDVLLPLFDKFRDRLNCQHVIVIPTEGGVPEGALDYEQLLAAEDPAEFVAPELDERSAAAMCYTSGTTGKPKGVVYSHRAVAVHSMGAAMTDTLGISEADVVLPIVPMFHANAWGLPFACALVGASQIFPGPFLDPESVLDLLEREKVTVTGGVPTVWLGMLQLLDKAPGKRDLSRIRSVIVGGSAAPRSLIQGLQERHGLRMLHSWGMTELAPLGTVCNVPSDLCDAPKEQQYDLRIKQGFPAPFIEIRARGEEGFAPWDGQSVGELEVRGPWVASAYHDTQEGAASFTEDGWFRTGDIVSIDARGCIQIQDRAKDVIKSGGEWISSVALENALMGHPAVAEAAVIAVPHEKWQERPLAVAVLKEGESATEQELIDFLADQFAKWWLPDAVVFANEIPRTSAGKFKKIELREQYNDHLLNEKTAQ